MTPADKDQIVWGWLRLVLGFAQISLVGLSFGSLITVGARPITWVFAVLATALAVTSLLIYRTRRAPGSAKRDLG